MMIIEYFHYLLDKRNDGLFSHDIIIIIVIINLIRHFRFMECDFCCVLKLITHNIISITS